MDCTYIALYPVFRTPQSTLHTTCHSPINTHSYRAVYLTLGTHIHTHAHTVGHAQGYIDMLAARAGIEPTTFWLKDDRTPSQPVAHMHVKG